MAFFGGAIRNNSLTSHAGLDRHGRLAKVLRKELWAWAGRRHICDSGGRMFSTAEALMSL
jgi:hypothetical protein